MAKSIMVIATESGTGKSVVSLGLCDAFARHGARVAYFKPVGNHADGNRDDDVTFIKKGALLPQPAEDMVALGPDDVAHAIQSGRYDDAIDKIIEAHGKLARDADIIVCEGVDSVSAFPALESDINIDFAKNVDASMVLVTSAAERDTDEVISHILVARSRLVERGASLAGVFVNRVDPRHHADLCDQVRRRLQQHDIPFFGALPELRVLSAPRLTDVVRMLDATVISGDKEALEARIGDIVVVAMGLEHALHYVKDNCLIITPGDREEILLAAAACHACKDAVRPAGVVLTGGFEPSTRRSPSTTSTRRSRRVRRTSPSRSERPSKSMPTSIGCSARRSRRRRRSSRPAGSSASCASAQGRRRRRSSCPRATSTA
jgi:phosphate acetyltransferase